MKVINYKRDYNTFFDCVIHGRIIVSKKEWEAIKKYVHPYLFDKNDLQRELKVKSGSWYNIRVSATDKVAKHFGLTKYRQVNYVFEVTN